MDTPYTLTTQLLNALYAPTARVEAHDFEAGEEDDVIYLQEARSDLSDGLVFSIEAFPGTPNFLIALESAHHVGGWPTYWSTAAGPQEQVLAEALDKISGCSQTRHLLRRDPVA